MDKPETYERLTRIFHEVFNDDSIALRPDLRAVDVDGWDSLSHIRLVLSVQKAFGVKFSAGDIGRLKNVEDLVDLIRCKSF